MANYKVEQSLNKYVNMFEDIYEPIQNNERDFYQILARLLESVAACSQFVNKGYDLGIAENLPIVFSWYCSLVTKSNLNTDIEAALWRKFPNNCPYCLRKPCNCANSKKSLEDNSESLQSLSKDTSSKPSSLDEWQILFAQLYPRNPQGYDQKSNLTHLIEELGEVSEAFRIRYFFPTALESELADVFTWIVGIANLIDAKAREGHIGHFANYRLAEITFNKYPSKCSNCKRLPCNCVNSQAKQKISELNVIYPDDIIAKVWEVMESMKMEIKADINGIFSKPETQTFINELKNQCAGKEIIEETVRVAIESLKKNEKHLKWYQQIRAAGIAESGIVSILTLLVQKYTGF